MKYKISSQYLYYQMFLIKSPEYKYNNYTLDYEDLIIRKNSSTIRYAFMLRSFNRVILYQIDVSNFLVVMLEVV